MSQVDPAPFPRRHDLDALRAGAMLVGIALHAALSFVSSLPWVVKDSQSNEVLAFFFYAVHGFRMPLFFLVSGFFTAMLWRQRGLKQLIRHRFLRIFLPMVLAMITILPLMGIVTSFAFVGEAQKLQKAGAAAQAGFTHSSESLQEKSALSESIAFFPTVPKEEVEALARMRKAYWSWVASSRFEVTKTRSIDDQPFHLFFTPVFHHLWFLWFLCWLVAFFLLFAWVAHLVSYQRPPQSLLLTPWRLLWLLPLTFLPQYLMGILGPSFGPDTSVGLLPLPHLLFYYGIFFAFGVLYFDCDDQQAKLGRYWWLSLPFAMCIAFPVGLSTMKVSLFFTSIAQVNFVWGMTFGLMGLCRRLLKEENRTLRYLSDSSYWLYLAHLPLVLFAQQLIREWRFPAMLKFALISVVVTAILLMTYQVFVRHTLIGRLLNGPRNRSQPREKILIEEAADS